MGWWVDGGSHRINFDAKRAVQNTDCPESDHVSGQGVRYSAGFLELEVN